MGTMSNALKVGALMAVLAAAAVALPPAPAVAQANCQWYGTTALKQQQDNARLKCGFTGQAWHSDLREHVIWCSGVAPDVWRQMARKRDQDLAACAVRKR